MKLFFRKAETMHVDLDYAKVSGIGKLTLEFERKQDEHDDIWMTISFPKVAGARVFMMKPIRMRTFVDNRLNDGDIKRVVDWVIAQTRSNIREGEPADIATFNQTFDSGVNRNYLTNNIKKLAAKPEGKIELVYNMKFMELAVFETDDKDDLGHPLPKKNLHLVTEEEDERSEEERKEDTPPPPSTSKEPPAPKDYSPKAPAPKTPSSAPGTPPPPATEPPPPADVAPGDLDGLQRNPAPQKAPPPPTPPKHKHKNKRFRRKH
jgi:hypothetical protein